MKTLSLFEQINGFIEIMESYLDAAVATEQTASYDWWRAKRGARYDAHAAGTELAALLVRDGVDPMGVLRVLTLLEDHQWQRVNQMWTSDVKAGLYAIRLKLREDKVAGKWTPTGPTMTRREVMAHHGVVTQTVTRAWERGEFEGDGEIFDAAGVKRWKPLKPENAEAIGIELRKAEIAAEARRPARDWTCKSCGHKTEAPSIRQPKKCPKCSGGVFE